MQLRKGFFEIRQNQVVGAAFAHQLDQMEFISRERRILKLPVRADSGNDAAQLVVLFDCLQQRVVGHVHAVDLAQLVQHVVLQLPLIVLQRVIFGYKGGIDVAHEELFVILLHKVQHLEVFMGAVHHTAGLGADQRVEEVIAALNGAFQQTAGIHTGLLAHVVGGDGDVRDARRAHTHREAAVEVQKHFGHVIAGVTQRLLPFGERFVHEFVFDVAEQALEKYAVF